MDPRRVGWFGGAVLCYKVCRTCGCSTIRLSDHLSMFAAC
jgi:hypothetical protein